MLYIYFQTRQEYQQKIANIFSEYRSIKDSSMGKSKESFNDYVRKVRN